MAALKLMMLAGCFCVFVWAFQPAVELGFLQLKPTSINQDNFGCVASAHNVHLCGRRSRLPLVSASFRYSFKTESSVQNSALLQFRYPTLGQKLCFEYLSNPLQINFLARGRLAADGFHSALPTPVRLLKYSSCVYWSRSCMCFVILLMCHRCARTGIV